jgi:hypothetical protein
MADVRAPAVSKTKEERARPLQPHLGRPTRERDEEGTALRPPRRPKAKEREGGRREQAGVGFQATRPKEK